MDPHQEVELGTIGGFDQDVAPLLDGSGVHPQLQAQVPADAGAGRRGEGDGNRVDIQTAQAFEEAEVGGTEVMSPLADAVGLVQGEIADPDIFVGAP